MTMLDHFLEIHRPLEMEPDMKEYKARKRTVKKINVCYFCYCSAHTRV